ncbi:30S ribosomal protein S6 [Sulfurimonas sp.]|uniref:30S ribosomal protein S6 n=1 Tax=Sulfurimonas sp. TaxID=2022749 RepID=UPI002AB00E1E|nr:30S ribosomal protein S6 [Sulfurimonas sp.]
MRKYENLVIVKPTFTAEEIQASIKAIEEIITSNGGEIATTDSMGMRKLAYPIDKNERGYYHVIYYSIAPSAITEIERRFRINEDLLRFITIKYDSNREITAWNQLVQKAEKKAAIPAKEEAPKEETPVVEETPAVVTEAPVVEETPAATEEVAKAE